MLSAKVVVWISWGEQQSCHVMVFGLILESVAAMPEGVTMPPNADVETANRAWLDKVLLAERTVKEVATLAAKMPGNPFEALSRVKEVIRKLEDSGLERLAPPAELLVQLNAACLRERAEFWDRLAE